jgi:hypothetical protein
LDEQLDSHVCLETPSITIPFTRPCCPDQTQGRVNGIVIDGVSKHTCESNCSSNNDCIGYSYNYSYEKNPEHHQACFNHSKKS